MANRPLSPHLQIYKWGPHMALSITHRITGSAMAFVGLPILLWWLGSMASGPDAYETFAAVMGSPIGILVLVGLSLAFFMHMFSGLRHFVLDIGAGYEIQTNKTWSLVVFALGIIVTVLFWAIIFLK